jgi:hypothetical protein
MAIDWPRVRRWQRRRRSAHSRSHRPHITLSRVILSRNTCRCHSVRHRIGDILNRRPHSYVHLPINISIISISINNISIHIRIPTCINPTVPHSRMLRSSLARRASVMRSGKSPLFVAWSNHHCLPVSPNPHHLPNRSSFKPIIARTFMPSYTYYCVLLCF